MKQYDSVLIGDINLDLILTGLSGLPIPGRELLCDALNVALGGSTSICGCAMAALGLSCGFVSKIGDDDLGRIALKFVCEAGVDTRYVIRDPALASGLTISLSTPEDRALLTYLGTIAELKVEDIPMDLLDCTRHIHVGSFFLQSKLRHGLAAFFRQARSKHVFVTLDAGWDDSEQWDGGIFDVLPHVDVFFPNEAEACAITRKDSVEEAAAVLAEYCRTVVVKCGRHGAYLQSGNYTERCPAYAGFTPVDTTGAGDSFNAGFIYGHWKGVPLSACLQYGNACAAISITRIGGASQCATAAELERIVCGETLA